MTSLISIRIGAEPLRFLAFGAIGNAFTALGTPFAHPIRILLLQNTTDQLLIFSFDGVNEHFVIPSEGFLLLDVTANRTLDPGFFFSVGTQVYVEYVFGAPTQGDVYLSAFYGISNDHGIM